MESVRVPAKTELDAGDFSQLLDLVLQMLA
jgi:hypothetical protein